MRRSVMFERHFSSFTYNHGRRNPMKRKKGGTQRGRARKSFGKMLEKLTDEDRIQLLLALQKDFIRQARIRRDERQKQLANMIQSVAYDVGLLKTRLEQMKSFRGQIDKPSVLRGYHGTTLFAANGVKESIARGLPEPFVVSKNLWDWLGSGVYFWLEAPHRAADRAYWWYKLSRRQHPWLPNLFNLGQYPPPKDHRSHFAVIEARIRLFPETSINLLDISWMEALRNFTKIFETQ